jgi:[CysO sulfur-carrier protein]-S-L-cysteine hydrolase
MGEGVRHAEASGEQVFVQKTVIDAMIAHALEDAPQECCGLLLGAGRRIVRAVRTRNAHAGTTRYLINPEDHFAAISEARSLGLSIVGAYHSHPASAPIPSPRDLEDATHDFFYLIVSLVDPGGPEVRAFELKQGNCRPIRLDTTPSPRCG